MCLFLGASFAALEDAPLPAHTEEGPGPSDSSSSRLKRDRFLNMIDTRIGLPRFNDLLRRPLSAGRGGNRGVAVSVSSDFFFTSGFKVRQHFLMKSFSSTAIT